MKPLSAILLLLTASFALAQSWEWQNPLPTGNDLNSVVSLNGRSLLAFGDLGTVLRTTDVGAHWVDLHSGLTSDLNASYFRDALHGWVVGGTSG